MIKYPYQFLASNVSLAYKDMVSQFKWRTKLYGTRFFIPSLVFFDLRIKVKQDMEQSDKQLR